MTASVTVSAASSLAIPPSILDELARSALSADQRYDWPVHSLQILRSTDAYRWSIPDVHGGLEYETVQLLAAYEDLASFCLTTAFIFSQRDAALRRMVAFAGEEFKSQWLPRFAAGDLFTTIGLSQLTTSRQHGATALLVAERADGSFELDGEIPWVSGADQAVLIVIGGKDERGRQYLFALPVQHPQVTVEAPMPLLALRGSRTTRLVLHQVVLEPKWLLIGPVEEIPALGRGGTGGLETSCLALGLARSVADFLQAEAGKRSELTELAVQSARSIADVRRRMHALAQNGGNAAESAALRADATQLALSLSQMALITAKGAGFVAGHLVERLVRQALFFLVWSCPRPVQMELLGAQQKLLCPFM